MFYKIIKLMSLLVLLVCEPLKSKAENLQRDKIFLPGNLSSPRYFYTTCRDYPALIRNPEAVTFDNPRIVEGLSGCTTDEISDT